MWKAIRFDVPLKTIYAWYQPDKREAMNVNDRSLRICSTSLREVRTGKKGYVGALAAMLMVFTHETKELSMVVIHKNGTNRVLPRSKPWGNPQELKSRRYFDGKMGMDQYCVPL